MWKDYTQKDKHRLATSWQAVQGHRPGVRGIGAVVDWQQMTGYLVKTFNPLNDHSITFISLIKMSFFKF